MDSRQNPVEPLLWGSFGWTRNHLRLTCITRPTKKSESQRVMLVGRSNWNILYLSSLCQTLSSAFLASRKAAATCSPLLKLSMMDWDSINRWSSNSFIIELIRLMGLQLVVREGSLSGFSNVRRVAIFHAVGI